eukprot:CAMPEP_0197616354 /NCGR_PEP_ID=MMETSP1326-20131121/60488_1 /TAXON_ID=1155430 /ORGANISM="Genus nov. species nov., Strain RCC2288" /LENGTH=238 /DNA_ID=CAMNT_0043185241 /DNA_START=1443 /DNA_END=2156 /DNA_ORIENTATION=-
MISTKARLWGIEQGADAPTASGMDPTTERALIAAMAAAVTGAKSPPKASHLAYSTATEAAAGNATVAASAAARTIFSASLAVNTAESQARVRPALSMLVAEYSQCADLNLVFTGIDPSVATVVTLQLAFANASSAETGRALLYAAVADGTLAARIVSAIPAMSIAAPGPAVAAVSAVDAGGAAVGSAAAWGAVSAAPADAAAIAVRVVYNFVESIYDVAARDGIYAALAAVGVGEDRV